MSLHRFSFATLPVSRWRNGGGETREIVSQPAGADFNWRASIATIAQSGPFSLFPGIDRSITLLAGDGVRLFSEGLIDHSLARIGEPFAFPGDVALHATLRGGASQDFNIMVRRGRWAANVQRLAGPVQLPAGHDGVLYVLCGRWQWVQQQTAVLAAGEGGWWRQAAAPARFVPQGSEPALALWADIHPC